MAIHAMQSVLESLAARQSVDISHQMGAGPPLEAGREAQQLQSGHARTLRKILRMLCSDSQGACIRDDRRYR